MTYARFSTNQPSTSMFDGKSIGLIACLSACIVQVTSNVILQHQHLDALPTRSSHDHDSTDDATRFTASENPSIARAEEPLADLVQDRLSGDESLVNLVNPDWNAILYNLADAFRHSSHAFKQGYQFGILYMGYLDEANVKDYACNLNLRPVDKQGHPDIDNKVPLSPKDTDKYVNYVYARPIPAPTAVRAVHSENQLVTEKHNLTSAYRKQFNRSPNTIIMYSYIMPCNKCTNQIITQFQRAKEDGFAYRAIGYTSEGLHLPYMTQANNTKNRNKIGARQIQVVHVDIKPQATDTLIPPVMTYETGNESTNDWSDVVDQENDRTSNPDTNMPLLHESFQGCMLHCLESDVCCSCTEEGKKSMTAVLVNELTDACVLSDIEACADQWIRPSLTREDKRGGASNCTDPDTVASNIKVCASKCTGRPFSKPLNPKDPDMYPGRLSAFTDLSDLPDVDLTEFCEDIRAEGLLCTVYRSDSFTAGNTRCRKHNRCGYHGYAYSWCYVDWSNHWDYCCTSDCGFMQETSYEWCHSGNTWQYCGV